MSDNYQRRGAVSNAHVGREFEEVAKTVLESAGISVSLKFPVKVGVSKLAKSHNFDLGEDNPAVIVECKSHRWTSGSNVPSAKLTVWNEAMYYFACAPNRFRKIFFVLKDVRTTNGETLSEYYIRTYSHLIPPGVEIWEYDKDTGKAATVYKQ